MKASKNPKTGESEVYLTNEEAEVMKEMIRGSSLPHRRLFFKLLELL